MAFLGPGDIRVLEKSTGMVRRVLNGVLQAFRARRPRQFLERTRAPRHRDQRQSSPRVFLYYTENPPSAGDSTTSTPLGSRICRYVWSGSTLDTPMLVLDLSVEPGPNHNGGYWLLGPAEPGLAGDGGPLYAVIGDLNRDNQLENFAGGGNLADQVADDQTEANQLRIGSAFAGITDLKIGPEGNLYVVSIGGGKIYRIRRGRSHQGSDHRFNPDANADCDADPDPDPDPHADANPNADAHSDANPRYAPQRRHRGRHRHGRGQLHHDAIDGFGRHRRERPVKLRGRKEFAQRVVPLHRRRRRERSRGDDGLELRHRSHRLEGLARQALAPRLQPRRRQRRQDLEGQLQDRRGDDVLPRAMSRATTPAAR
jgi:hypothetical protein